ncbi:hypothetical protein LEMLEM_LOCUS14021, partial [Lemmus lemmus]
MTVGQAVTSATEMDSGWLKDAKDNASWLPNSNSKSNFTEQLSPSSCVSTGKQMSPDGP